MAERPQGSPLGAAGSPVSGPENLQSPGTTGRETRPLRPLPLATGQPPSEDGPDPNAEILVRAQRGDRDAFRQLVENTQDMVFALVTRWLRCDRDTAADVSQDIYLRVFRGLNDFDGRARFTTWLHKITTNACISAQRHRKALKRGRTTLSIDAPIDGTDDLHIEPEARVRDPGEQVHQREFVAAAHAAIHELPEEFKSAVILRDLQDLSYEEIGAILGIPPGTVRSRIHRGRLLLQEKLGGFLG